MTRRKRRRFSGRAGCGWAPCLPSVTAASRRPLRVPRRPAGTGGSMSVAGLKKQFYKASQVRHRHPRPPSVAGIIKFYDSEFLKSKSNRIPSCCFARKISILHWC